MKQMKRRILAGVLSMQMLLGTASVAVATDNADANLHERNETIVHETIIMPDVVYATSGTCGANATWKLENGVLTISGTGAIEDYDGLTASSAHWSGSQDEIQRIVINPGITRIGNYAFWGTNAVSVSIPSSVTSIGIGAFEFNHFYLASVNIPDSVTYIGPGAFSHCYALQRVTLPARLTSIENRTFSDCYSLSSVTIPDGVDAIGVEAFKECRNLKSLNIPDSVTTIGKGAFDGCKSLVGSITIPDGVTDIGDYTFCYCTKLDGISIPDGVTSIGKYAFEGCGLTALTIPDSVTAVGERAFGTCTALTHVTIPDSIVDIADGMFFGCSKLEEVTLPDSIISIGENAFAFCHALSSIALPDSLVAIGNSAFENCRFTSITIPNRVSSIGTRAFALCYALSDITIPRNVTQIAEDAFEEIENSLTISCYRGSYAHQYAVRKNMKYKLLDVETIPELQSVTMLRNGVSSDLLTAKETFEANSPETVGIAGNIDWKDFEGCSVALEQSEENVTIPLPTDGTSVELAPGQRFTQGAPIHIVIRDAEETILVKQELGLYIVSGSSISIQEERLRLEVGETASLDVRTVPESAGYTLTSSNPEIVSISENALTANQIGQATITAALADEPAVTATCQVTVYGYDNTMKAVAASQLAYENLLAFQGRTVVEVAAAAGGALLADLKLWSQMDEPGLVELYQDVLGSWTISSVHSYPSGLFAIALDSPDENIRILAFRGTEADLGGTVDWGDIISDVQMAVFNRLPKQFQDAISFYQENSITNREILLTGHSLGGAVACYLSLQTGLRAELFNAANGLMIEDAYYAGGENIVAQFQGNDLWNFVNHITKSDGAVSDYINGALLNRAITYHNIANLPSEIHDISKTAITVPPVNDAHKLQSMIEYDKENERFQLSESYQYNQGAPQVKQFEMTRVDALYAVRKLLEAAPANKFLEHSLNILDLFEDALNEDYLKVKFLFGTSNEDTIIGDTILEQVFLYGGDGNDTMRGGCINDVLSGGNGVNAMDGGPMNDQYFITGNGVQFINDCSGTDTIYLPSGVRVVSHTSRYEQGYDVLALSNGQEIMLNRNRKANARFLVYSLDGFDCGSYTILPEIYKRSTSDISYVEGEQTKTFEIIGNSLILRILDRDGQELERIDVEKETFPYYTPYGYFYYENGRMRAHLFNNAYQVDVAVSHEQDIVYSAITHDENDLPVCRVSTAVLLTEGDVLSAKPKENVSGGFHVSLQSKDGISEDVSLTVENLTALGYSVVFKVTPEYAAVVILDADGNTVKAAEPNSYVLQPDVKYTYQVSSPDYQTESESFMVDRDTVITVNLKKSETEIGMGGNRADTYSIALPGKVTGGEISLSKRYAKKGETVDVTATPDKGYELDKLTVTDSRGSELDLDYQGNGKYTFTMPAGRVEIGASFREIPVKPVNPFADVSESNYYYDAVLWAVENGVTNGTTDTTFSPDMTVSRSQMVTFLWRAYGSPEATGENPFTDVSESEYYYDAVLWAAANGITVGTTDTTFSPEDPVTRAQAVTFQWRAAGSPAVTCSSFDDVEADTWYTQAVVWAVANEITNGTGGNIFSPDMVASRAQAVTFLYREFAE